MDSQTCGLVMEKSCIKVQQKIKLNHITRNIEVVPR